jgi:hypothetical protein
MIAEFLMIGFTFFHVVTSLTNQSVVNLETGVVTSRKPSRNVTLEIVV